LERTILPLSKELQIFLCETRIVMKRAFLLLLTIVIIFLASSFWSFKADWWVLERPILLAGQGLASVSLNLRSTIMFFLNMPTIYKENQKLKLELTSFSGLEVVNGALTEENAVLRKQLGEKNLKKLQFLPVGVLGNIQENGALYYLLDKGSADGVLEKQSVVLENIFLGVVEKVSRESSLFLPATAPTSSIPVEIRSPKGKFKGQGILVGQYNISLKLDKVLPEVELNVGDWIVTSGEGNIIKPGFLIGKVDKIFKKDNQIFQWASVNSAIDFSLLNIVFVVQDNQ